MQPGPLSGGQRLRAPTITGSVRKLEAAGLVLRRPSPKDGRVTIVELSERGQALLPDLRAAWQQLAELSVTGLTVTPVDQLSAALVDLAHSLTATDAPAGQSAPPTRTPTDQTA